ncbi:MFS transporter [Endozoicomonas montiporae]|uniref:cytochrome-c oxidase n=2 Tax=Endozoicomonas montiporae TaxID=1027273 RepID=A0A081N0A8_9GAMM|nr:cytochrome c oxidase subunit 3 [Endozoicomonas montiporae]AMO54334.1 cytochrome c oxidase subunit III [Endozoicomonas montiporae CL-33]KEQ11881.1 MFS transporter [Endozoicomonas montiporae]
MADEGSYYVPAQSKWPIIASIGMFVTLAGAGMMMNDMSAGVKDSIAHYVMFAGALIMAYMLFGWFGNVIKESHDGLYSAQMDRSFRWGMSWFIFSEVMFFFAFFGTLFYIRMFSVPWLGGEGHGAMTNQLLWPEFEAGWPLMKTPDNETFPGPDAIIDPFHLPLLNTLLLVASSITLTIAHHALRKNERKKVIVWLAATLVLGFTFLFFQAEEYIQAYNELGLTLSAGIYGSTFFILTGFHGAHVTLGALMLTIMFVRVLKGHFEPEKHFAFEASSWYWHFVDVVWIGLFIFVYLL